MARMAEMRRILKDVRIGRGIGCIETGEVFAFTFCVRNHDITLGTKIGPSVKRRVFALLMDQ